jgi:hypothetical protein
MGKPAEIDLVKLLTDKMRYGRSPMQRWLYENYDQILAAMPGPRRNWRVLAEAAIEAGQTDADGNPPNANSMRAAFSRVHRLKETASDTVTEKPSGQPRSNSPLAPASMPPERPLVAPQPPSDDEDDEKFFRTINPT